MDQTTKDRLSNMMWVAMRGGHISDADVEFATKVRKQFPAEWCKVKKEIMKKKQGETR